MTSAPPPGRVGERGRRSPARRARPPRPPQPPRRSVAALPRTGTTAIPPATARQARSPEVTRPIRSRSPRRSVREHHGAAARAAPSASSTLTAHSPATATRTSPAVTSRWGPLWVISRAAAPAGLPARRLASRSAPGSTAPPEGTPSRRTPRRPASWTVVSSPGARTRSPSTAQPPAHRGGRPSCAAASSGSTATKRTRSPGASAAGGSASGSKRRTGVRPTMPPAGGGGDGVDAGEPAGDRDRPGGDPHPRLGVAPGVERRGEPGEVGEAGEVAEHGDAVESAAVGGRGLHRAHPRRRGDGVEVGAVLAAVDDRDRPLGSLPRLRRGRLDRDRDERRAELLGAGRQWVVDDEE